MRSQSALFGATDGLLHECLLSLISSVPIIQACLLRLPRSTLDDWHARNSG
uniref:Uncharacterized protein n=1 Tax=Arion vulgaris TaxID=1028688 RepID=A0A0B6ZE39_9EUPU